MRAVVVASASSRMQLRAGDYDIIALRRKRSYQFHQRWGTSLFLNLKQVWSVCRARVWALLRDLTHRAAKSTDLVSC